MATLEQIDATRKLSLTAYRQDLDRAYMGLIEGVASIEIEGEDVGRLLAWAKRDSWRQTFEEDLQCVSEVAATGEPLLSTWIPLVTFRASFCLGGRDLQDASTVALMQRIRDETRHWRDAGADIVVFDGYRLG